MDQPPKDGSNVQFDEEIVLDPNNNSTDSLPGQLPEPEDHDVIEEEGAGQASPRRPHDDPIEETLEMNTAVEIEDTILQLDGNNSDSSDADDEFGVNDVFGLNKSRKRRRVQIDSSEGDGEEEERATAPLGQPRNVTSDSEDEGEERNEKEANLIQVPSSSPKTDRNIC